MVDAPISTKLRAAAGAEVSLAAKVAFLRSPGALPGRHPVVTAHETHMSWLFFAGEGVFKLKKPVRLPYLDFSTLAQRKAACEAEFRLNQHLAPGVYRAVLPLVRVAEGLRLGGPGEVVDWLVEMRRLDQRLTLEARLQEGRLARSQVDALAARLAAFYAHAPRPHRSLAQQRGFWRALLALNRRVLLDPTLGMPGGAVRHVLAVQGRFLRRRADLIGARVRARRLVDAHGDLRPEHIWIGPPILIIDRLEFSADLRCVDWSDELSFLEIESQRLGAGEVGARIRQGVCARLHDRPSEPLRLFYATMRAMLRARLAIAHLSEPNPRSPEKWPRQAREYLAIASRHAKQLQRLLRTPAGR